MGGNQEKNREIKDLKSSQLDQTGICRILHPTVKNTHFPQEHMECSPG